jgi:four helix bundle protein
MRDFERLEVWKYAHRFALEMHSITQNFPRTEIFGLTSQVRRASLSISANIAEGCGRRSDKDFAHFLDIAMGSAKETDCLLRYSRDLGYLTEVAYRKLKIDVTRIQKMLTALIHKVRPFSH